MFGYVKPYVPDLRVREDELYRAVYCGLCLEMGRTTGQLSRMSLSYDLVFLAAARMLASGEKPDVLRRRCAAHPVKKRQMLAHSDSLHYAAAVSAILVGGKVDDDVIDEKGLKKLASLSLKPACRHMVKKARRALGADDTVTASVEDGLGTLREYEAAGENSIDKCADSFGLMMAEIFSAGLEEKEARVLYEIGRGAGRFVYVADAMDDFPEDVKKGRFNPICAFYGEDAVLRDGKEVFLSPEVAGELMRATLLELSKTASCAELICDGGDAGLSAIVRNVLYLGMPETMKKICKRRVHPAADTEGKNK